MYKNKRRSITIKAAENPNHFNRCPDGFITIRPALFFARSTFLMETSESQETAVAATRTGSDDDLSSVRRRGSAAEEPVGYSKGDQHHERRESVDLTTSGRTDTNLENRGGSRTGFTYRPSVPAHQRIKESPLSSNAIFDQSHAGLLNLCIVVLIAVNSRLIIENLMKYGWLIKPGFWFNSRSLKDWPLFMCCISLSFFPIVAFIIEKLVHQKSLSERAVVTSHVVNSAVAVLYPVIMILCCDSAFLSGVTLMLVSCIVWMKLVSYAHTNYDMRALLKSSEKDVAAPSCSNVDYSCGLNLKSLAYFMVAPTLCYQPRYPRTASIRKGWVLRHCIKLIIFTGVMGFIIEQYINPIVQNSQHPLKVNLLYGIERVLKLSVPTLYVWLCMFYTFFHLWLNILAELLQFGDREFYKDWWNAKTVEEYWRMWNMPVHKWIVRHTYFPCLRNGIPKVAAFIIAFLVSAVFHELCIAVPCHVFKLWAFLGIMFQVPLVSLTNYLQNKFKNSMVGNMVFWFFFSVFGQPMCVLLYYHDLMNRNEQLD